MRAQSRLPTCRAPRFRGVPASAGGAGKAEARAREAGLPAGAEAVRPGSSIPIAVRRQSDRHATLLYRQAHATPVRLRPKARPTLGGIQTLRCGQCWLGLGGRIGCSMFARALSLTWLTDVGGRRLFPDRPPRVGWIDRRPSHATGKPSSHRSRGSALVPSGTRRVARLRIYLGGDATPSIESTPTGPARIHIAQAAAPETGSSHRQTSYWRSARQ